MAAAFAPAQPKAGDHLYLRYDKKLQVTVQVQSENPTLEEMLQPVREATGYKLTIHSSLQRHRPKFATGSRLDAKGWMILNEVAATDLEEGRWQRIDKDYQLVAKASKREQGHVDPPPPLPNWREDPHYLARDPKLHVPVTIVAVEPKLEDLLQRVRDATGLTLTVDPSLSKHEPRYGDIQLKNSPAWQTMRLISRVDLDAGHWERTSTGYHLTATRSLHEREEPPVSAPLSSTRRWLTIGSIAGIVLVSAGIVFRRLRSARTKKSATVGSPQPPSGVPS